jgi:hypothetical protein
MSLRNLDPFTGVQNVPRCRNKPNWHEVVLRISKYDEMWERAFKISG